MSYQTILVSEEKPLGIITLNRPEALNALNGTMRADLVDALASFENNESVRCIIITGSDRAFCAGADIKDMADQSTVDMIKSENFRSLWEKLGRYPKPLIGAVSGYALGGGLELAMSCDIVIAAEGTKLGQPEINIGIMPGAGGTQRLIRAVGKYKAMEMILTGTMITAEDAKLHGLVNRVVPPRQQVEEAKKVGLEVAAKGPIAVRLAKKAINEAYEVGLSDGLDYERQLFYQLFATQDKDEGMKAFIEKRKPEFKGL
jgi:enoyl-CoA hydratase